MFVLFWPPQFSLSPVAPIGLSGVINWTISIARAPALVIRHGGWVLLSHSNLDKKDAVPATWFILETVVSVHFYFIVYCRRWKGVLKMFLLLFHSYSEKYTFSHPIPKLYLHWVIFKSIDLCIWWFIIDTTFSKFDLWSFDAIQNIARVFEFKIDTFDMI